MKDFIRKFESGIKDFYRRHGLDEELEQMVDKKKPGSDERKVESAGKGEVTGDLQQPLVTVCVILVRAVKQPGLGYSLNFLSPHQPIGNR